MIVCQFPRQDNQFQKNIQQLTERAPLQSAVTFWRNIFLPSLEQKYKGGRSRVQSPFGETRPSRKSLRAAYNSETITHLWCFDTANDSLPPQPPIWYLISKSDLCDSDFWTHSPTLTDFPLFSTLTDFPLFSGGTHLFTGANGLRRRGRQTYTRYLAENTKRQNWTRYKH